MSQLGSADAHLREALVSLSFETATPQTTAPTPRNSPGLMSRAKILHRRQHIVRAAVQRHISCVVAATQSEGMDVVVFQQCPRATAVSVRCHIRASPSIALVDRAFDHSRERATPAILPTAITP